MTKNISRNFKIGALVISAILLLYFGLNYLKGNNIFKADNAYYILLDNVDGLQKTAPINVKGFKAGQIANIKYEPMNRHPFTVVLFVSKKMQLPANTKVEVYNDGLLGSKAVRLVFDEKDIVSDGQKFAAGDTIPAVTVSGFMDKVQNEMLTKVSDVVAQTDSLIYTLRTLMHNVHIEKSFAALETTTAALATSSVQLNKLMNNDVPQILANANNITSDLNAFSGDIKNVEISKTVDSLNSAIANLKNISEKINSADGTLGALMNDKQLYNNLQSVTDNANKLLIDLKQNPKRYVRFSIW